MTVYVTASIEYSQCWRKRVQQLKKRKKVVGFGFKKT